MARPSIVVLHGKSLNEIAVLKSFINGAGSLQTQQQYLIAEVVLLRLFSIFEVTAQEVAFRLACGTKYRNGNSPLTLINCSSIIDAHSKMLSHGRRRPLPYLRWTMTTYIEDSIKYVLDLTDVYFSRITTYNASLDEMRIVRNQIAHRTTSTKRAFNSILISRYGANPRLTMGAFLTSTIRHPVSNISRYLAEMKIILDEITLG